MRVRRINVNECSVSKLEMEKDEVQLYVLRFDSSSYQARAGHALKTASETLFTYSELVGLRDTITKMINAERMSAVKADAPPPVCGSVARGHHNSMRCDRLRGHGGYCSSSVYPGVLWSSRTHDD